MTAARAMMLGVLFAVAVVGWVVTCANWQVEEVARGVRALDERSFDALTVIAVGTGGPYENQDRLGPAIGVGFGKDLVLVDAGRAVAEALRKANLPAAQPKLVALTGLAPEDTVGLDDLLLAGWLNGPRATPLRLVGPPGTIALARGLEQAHAVGIAAEARALGLPPEGARFDPVEVSGPYREERDGLVVTAAPLGDGAALIFRFEAKGRSAVVSGTSGDEEAQVAFAQDADAWVREAIHGESIRAAIAAAAQGDPSAAKRLEQEAALHADLDQAATAATRAGVRTLVLTRLRPPPVLAWQYEHAIGKRFPGNVVVAKDGDEIGLR
ncbi:MAG TPA: hypothetical protein VMW35_13070 [Myxococcota bacterium]|nr:hypothetical protein [Myxococcota bacterium]